MTVSSRNLHQQATTQGNKSDTEGKPADSGQQTAATGNGPSKRQQEEGPEAEHITQQSSDTKRIQRLTIPFTWKTDA